MLLLLLLLLPPIIGIGTSVITDVESIVFAVFPFIIILIAAAADYLPRLVVFGVDCGDGILSGMPLMIVEAGVATVFLRESTLHNSTPW
jgi:hypothetical protein